MAAPRKEVSSRVDPPPGGSIHQEKSMEAVSVIIALGVAIGLSIAISAAGLHLVLSLISPRRLPVVDSTSSLTS